MNSFSIVSLNLVEELENLAADIRAVQVQWHVTFVDGEEQRVEHRLVDEHLLVLGVSNSAWELGVCLGVRGLLFSIVEKPVQVELNKPGLVIQHRGLSHGCVEREKGFSEQVDHPGGTVLALQVHIKALDHLVEESLNLRNVIVDDSHDLFVQDSKEIVQKGTFHSELNILHAEDGGILELPVDIVVRGDGKVQLDGCVGDVNVGCVEWNKFEDVEGAIYIHVGIDALEEKSDGVGFSHKSKRLLGEAVNLIDV